MSYYDTGYDYGGYPVFVGTGFDEAWYMGLPPLSYVHQFGAIRERGRIEISSRDLIGHAIVYKGMDWGMTYALRKGFLDASMLGYTVGGRVYGSFAMGMRQVIVGGVATAVRKVSPWAVAYAAGAGLIHGIHSWIDDSIMDWHIELY